MLGQAQTLSIRSPSLWDLPLSSCLYIQLEAMPTTVIDLRKGYITSSSQWFCDLSNHGDADTSTKSRRSRDWVSCIRVSVRGPDRPSTHLPQKVHSGLMGTQANGSPFLYDCWFHDTERATGVQTGRRHMVCRESWNLPSMSCRLGIPSRFLEFAQFICLSHAMYMITITHSGDPLFILKPPLTVGIAFLLASGVGPSVEVRNNTLRSCSRYWTRLLAGILYQPSSQVLRKALSGALLLGVGLPEVGWVGTVIRERHQDAILDRVQNQIWLVIRNASGCQCGYWSHSRCLDWLFPSKTTWRDESDVSSAPNVSSALDFPWIFSFMLSARRNCWTR